ncbi:hypothetical protein H632_c1810p0, partial [Helicosporidium sp. ATCC 50920]
ARDPGAPRTRPRRRGDNFPPGPRGGRERSSVPCRRQVSSADPGPAVASPRVSALGGGRLEQARPRELAPGFAAGGRLGRRDPLFRRPPLHHPALCREHVPVQGGVCLALGRELDQRRRRELQRDAAPPQRREPALDHLGGRGRRLALVAVQPPGVGVRAAGPVHEGGRGGQQPAADVAAPELAAPAGLVPQQQLPEQGHRARAEAPGRAAGCRGSRDSRRALAAVRAAEPGGPAARGRQRRRHPHGHPQHHARERHPRGPPARDRVPILGAVASEAAPEHDARGRGHLPRLHRLSRERGHGRLLARALGPGLGLGAAPQEHDAPPDCHPAAPSPPHPRHAALRLGAQDHARGRRSGRGARDGQGRLGRRSPLAALRHSGASPRVVGAGQDRPGPPPPQTVLGPSRRPPRRAAVGHCAGRLLPALPGALPPLGAARGRPLRSGGAGAGQRLRGRGHAPAAREPGPLAAPARGGA